jgi:hypothetical protein
MLLCRESSFIQVLGSINPKWTAAKNFGPKRCPEFAMFLLRLYTFDSAAAGKLLIYNKSRLTQFYKPGFVAFKMLFAFHPDNNLFYPLFMPPTQFHNVFPPKHKFQSLLPFQAVNQGSFCP